MRFLLAASLLLAASAWASPPVQVACFGDSNTVAAWPKPGRIRWCEYAAQVCPTTTVRGRPPRVTEWFNVAIGRAHIVPGSYIETQLANARAVRADASILAFGTNDAAKSTPAQYAENVRLACRRIHQRRCWVMTMPPHPWLPNYEEYNVAVALVVPPERLIDRTTEMKFELDGIHLDDASERVLARRVASALGCPQATPTETRWPATRP